MVVVKLYRLLKLLNIGNVRFTVGNEHTHT